MNLIQKFSEMCDNFPYDFSNIEARKLAVTNYMTLFNLCKERNIEFYPVISERTFFHNFQLDRRLNKNPRLIIFDKDEVKLDLVDVKRLFTRLKEYDLKIAICTSDCLETTERFVQKYNLHKLIDHIVSSDTKNIIPKPSPDPVLLTCRMLDISPMDTWLVGGSYIETHTGINSGCGLIFGISKGDNKNFLSEADVISESPVDVLTQFLSFRGMS